MKIVKVLKIVKECQIVIGGEISDETAKELVMSLAKAGTLIMKKPEEEFMVTILSSTTSIVNSSITEVPKI